MVCRKRGASFLLLLHVVQPDCLYCSPQERRSPLRESKYQTGWWNAGNVSFHPIEKAGSLICWLSFWGISFYKIREGIPGG
nr:hypothetical protein Q903MT_gene2101 [Picea sitchensis]